MASLGKFIVLEGIDGCGKTTIAGLLAKKMKAWSTKEPTRKLQKKIEATRSKLSVLDMQKLYIADRITHTKKIKTTLAKNKTVILFGNKRENNKIQELAYIYLMEYP